MKKVITLAMVVVAVTVASGILMPQPMKSRILSFFDNTAPTITNIREKKVRSTEAVITWRTDELSTSKVYYSKTSPISFATALTAESDINEDCDEKKHKLFKHGVTLPNLEPETIYYYVVESKDMANNSSSSEDLSFITKRITDETEKPAAMSAEDAEEAKFTCKPVKVK